MGYIFKRNSGVRRYWTPFDWDIKLNDSITMLYTHTVGTWVVTSSALNRSTRQGTFHKHPHIHSLVIVITAVLFTALLIHCITVTFSSFCITSWQNQTIHVNYMTTRNVCRPLLTHNHKTRTIKANWPVQSYSIIKLWHEQPMLSSIKLMIENKDNP